MTNEVIIQDDHQHAIVEYQFSNVLNPEGANEIAKTIKHYATQNELVENIKGKPYPMVEAWQYAGLLLGLFPRVTKVEDLSKGDEIKYRAEVEVINKQTGEVMSSGIAICSNKESKKKYFEEYAICSMAQTRATGKAFRLLMGWMFKLAGFEGTPAEEMEEENTNVKTQGPTVGAITKEYRAFVMEAIKCCYNARDVRRLAAIAQTFMKIDPDAEVIDTCRKQFEMLSDLGKEDEDGKE